MFSAVQHTSNSIQAEWICCFTSRKTKACSKVESTTPTSLSPSCTLCHSLTHTDAHTRTHTYTWETGTRWDLFFFFFFTAREWSCWSEVTFTYEHRRDLRPPPWETFDSEALVREQDGSGLSSSCGLSLHCITLTRISHAFTCTNELLCVVLLIKGMYFGLTDLTDARFLYLYLILSLKLWL